MKSQWKVIYHKKLNDTSLLINWTDKTRAEYWGECLQLCKSMVKRKPVVKDKGKIGDKPETKKAANRSVSPCEFGGGTY